MQLIEKPRSGRGNREPFDTPYRLGFYRRKRDAVFFLLTRIARGSVVWIY
jgi:hypothetical protein